MILLSARDRKLHEYRLRLEAEAAPAADAVVKGEESVARSGRIEDHAAWVELRIQQAMRNGEFDDLPGAGKPIRGLDAPHDPDWWIKGLIERERISVLPPALALRKEHAQMDDILDRETTVDGVRRVIEDFNARIVDARRQLQGGPPVITPLRDAEAEVEGWARRRTERTARQSASMEQARHEDRTAAPLPRWRRLLPWLRADRRRLV